MKTIVHISADFPDAMNSAKTAVVKRLVEAAPGYRHVIYSLNRTNGWQGIASLPFGEDRLAIAYAAPPKGLFLHRGLLAVAHFVASDMAARGLRPDLYHAHKLTMEGLVVEALQDRMPAPAIVSIQGDTDLKILSARRDLAARYGRIAGQAASLISLAPWSRTAMAAALGIPLERIEVLPCLPGQEAMSAAPVIRRPHFAAVFHLLSASRKNLPGLARAASLVAVDWPDFRLDIYGGGSASQVLAAQGMIAKAGAAAVVHLRGPCSDVPGMLKHYAAMTVPTLRESYGLVHVEALFAGVPIMWSQDRGVDGLFPAQSAGYRCDPASDADIARGFRHLHAQEADLKQAIDGLQRDGALNHLRIQHIGAAYQAILARVLKAGSGA